MVAKKRGFAGDPVSETHEHLRNEMTQALDVVPKLQEPQVPPPSELGSLSAQELSSLLASTESLRSQSIDALEAWELYRQHLKSAMDAVMLLLSIRGGSSDKKRRRTTNIPAYQAVPSVGSRVVALHEGAWIDAEVYATGPELTLVSDALTFKAKERDVVLVQSPAPTLSAGAKVLALRGDCYLPAEVVSQSGHKVRVMFAEDEDDFRETELERMQVVLRPPR